MRRSKRLHQSVQNPLSAREIRPKTTALLNSIPLRRRFPTKQPAKTAFPSFSEPFEPGNPENLFQSAATLSPRAISQAKQVSKLPFRPIRKNFSQKLKKLVSELLPPRRSLEAKPAKVLDLSAFFVKRGKKVLKRPVGLLNVGLVCYRNATLNAFYAIDGVIAYFSAEQRQKTPLGDIFHTFFIEYQRNAVSEQTLTAFRDLMPAFPANTQYCAYQYFLGLLTALDKEAEPQSLLPANSASLLQLQLAKHRKSKIGGLFDLFSVVTESLFICRECQSSRRSFQFGRGLQVSIPRKWTVMEGNIVNFGESNFSQEELWQSYSELTDNGIYTFSNQLIQLYSSREAELQCQIAANGQDISLEDCMRFSTCATLMTAENMLNCRGCKRNTQHFKVSFIRHIGSVLVIHFQRFDEITQGKLYAKVRLPEELDMGKYGGNLGKYRLKAVIYHSGTMKGGHYTAQIRLDGELYSVDDSVVRRPKQGFSATNAYILYYEACSSVQSLSALWPKQ